MAKSKAVKNKEPEVYKGIVLDKVESQRLINYLEANDVELDITEDLDDAGIKRYLIDAYSILLSNWKENPPTNETGLRASFLECPATDGGCGAASLDTVAACPVCGMSDEPAGQETVALPDDVDENPSTEVITTSTEVVVHEGQVLAGEIQISTMNELEAAIERVKDLSQNQIRLGWDIGRELNDMKRAEGLWKQKLRPNSELPYPSFEKFVEGECKITDRYARNLMAFAHTISREDFERIGSAKLTLIIQAKDLDPKYREELLEKARAGTTLRDLKREVEKLLPANRQKVQSVGGDGSSAKTNRKRQGAQLPEPRAGQAPNSSEITCTFALGKRELRIKGKGKDTVYVSHETLIGNVEVEYTIDLKKQILTIQAKRV